MKQINYSFIGRYIMDKLKAIETGKDVGKATLHGGIAVGLTKIGCDSIQFGIDYAIDPDVPIRERALGAFIAVGGAINLKSAYSHGTKSLAYAKNVVKDVESILNDEEVFVEDIDGNRMM